MHTNAGASRVTLTIALCSVSFLSLATASESTEALPLHVIQTEAITLKQSWQLREGLPIHSQLQSWAEQSGWKLIWQPEFSWLAAADSTFHGDFSEAAEQVIEALFNEGQPVRIVMWQQNRVAEVVSHAR